MIDVNRAREVLRETVTDFGVELIPLEESVGRVLREDWMADRPMPPYDRVTMDGIAIRYTDYEAGTRTFEIAGIAAAGSPVMELTVADGCLEVMTGAILPDGTDTIIRYEDVEMEEDKKQATIATGVSVRAGQNVHGKGSDRLEGAVLCRTGKLIRAAEIGIGATIGKSMVKVSTLPKVVIVSTGDELVEIDQQPLPHQIRKSNVYRMMASLRATGIIAERRHLNDDMVEIKSTLQSLLKEFDIILLSGGVSKGKFDFLPEALDQVGVKKLFHKIRQRPGKPFWFGQHPNGTTVFAFPGNPVSSYMCHQVYFLPWLRASLGYPMPTLPYAELTAPITFKPDLTYFAQVKIEYAPNGKLLATPVQGNGSGDLANLTDADGFLELPEGKEAYLVGEVYGVWV